MNKKSQVKLITVVLIVLLVLGLIIILWRLVIPLINEKNDDVSLSAVSADLEIDNFLIYLTGASRVDVKAGSGMIDADRLRFVFYDENGDNHIEDVSDVMKSYEKKSYYFPPFNIGKIERISVIPVFNDNLGREFSAESDDVFEIPEGLVSWWGFDDFNDLVSSNDCSQGSVVEDEKKGNIAKFGESINCGNNETLDIIDEFSMGFWINTSYEDGVLIEKQDSYKIYLENGLIKFSCNAGEFVSDSYVSDNNWNYVLITGSFDAEILKIYINGELDKLLELKGRGLNKNSNFLIIGKNYEGYIDEIMIFNRALATPHADSLMKNTY